MFTYENELWSGHDFTILNAKGYYGASSLKESLTAF